MLIVPLKAVPNQAVTAVLGGQVCQIDVYQKFFGLFVDLYVNNALIIQGVLAENLNPIVRSAYLGFIGDLVFIDNQGSNDPDYTGLGLRFALAYLTPADVQSLTEGSPLAAA